MSGGAVADTYFLVKTLHIVSARVALIGKLVPRPVRDWAYDIVARNRYRWFGRTDQCALLTPDQRNWLVLEDEELRAQLKNA